MSTYDYTYTIQGCVVSTHWIQDSVYWHGKVLLGPYRHWCYEYDDLPIDANCSEFDHCLCFKENRDELLTAQAKQQYKDGLGAIYPK